MRKSEKVIWELRDGKTIKYTPRRFWSQIQRSETWIRLELPVQYVRFTSCGSEFCFTNKDCKRAIKMIQEDHIKLGFDDITHNFLIGGDRVLYEGRGWYFQSHLPGEETSLREKCLDIAYIGNINVVKPLYAMVVTFGLKQGFITPSFKMIPCIMPFVLGREVGMSIPLQNRDWWGAQAARWREPLTVPVEYVRLTHTGTNSCNNKDECVLTLRTIQQFHMDQLGLPDIPYSFMLGGDGMLYKGRGWITEPSRPPVLSWLKGRCIDIAFVGKYKVKRPHEKLMERVKKLITYGVVVNNIKENYKLIDIGEEPKYPF